MKLSSIKFRSISCLIIISLFLVSCYMSQKDNSTTEIPALLDRSEAIQLGTEWDFVQNTYVALREKANSGDKRALLDLANLYIQEARVTGEHGHYYPAALHVLAQILDDPGKESDLKFMALVTKAGVLLSLHEFADALETGREAVRINPNNAQVHGVLVDAYVEMGDYEMAVKHADRMVSIKPDLRSYSRVSYIREIYGDMEGAIEAMKMAVESGYPGREDTAWAALTYGDLLKSTKRYDEAIEVYKAILDTRPNYSFAINAIGEIKLEQGNIEEAEDQFLKAMKIIPEVGYYINLAKVRKHQNRHEELAELKKEIFTMLKDDIESGHNMSLEMARLYLEVFPDYDKALEIAHGEYQKRPENIDVNFLLSEIYTAKKDWDNANKHLASATRITDNSNRSLALKNAINTNISEQ